MCSIIINNYTDIDIKNLTTSDIDKIASFSVIIEKNTFNFILVEEVIGNETIPSVYLFKDYTRYTSFSLKKNNLSVLAIFCNDNMEYIPVNFSNKLTNFFYHDSTFKIYHHCDFQILSSGL